MVFSYPSPARSTTFTLGVRSKKTAIHTKRPQLQQKLGQETEIPLGDGVKKRTARTHGRALVHATEPVTACPIDTCCLSCHAGELPWKRSFSWR